MTNRNRSAILLTLLATVMLGGCVATTPPRGDDPELTALIARAEANPSDQDARGQLIDAYLKRWSETHDPSYRDRAMEQLRVFLNASPTHVGANATLYELLTQQILQTGGNEALPELRAVYDRTPMLKETPLPPPSLLAALLAVQKAQGPEDLKAALGIARQALRENPHHVGTRIFMSRLYQDVGNDTLALAMLEQAYRIQPENPKLLKRYSGALYDAARSRMCTGKKTYLDDAIGITKQFSKIAPKDPDALAHLVLLYQMRDQAEVALFSAKRLYEVETTQDNLIGLGDAYNLADHRDEAIQAYQQAMAADPKDASMSDLLAHVYFQRAEWAEARRWFLDYLDKADTPEPYGVMLLSLTDRLAREDGAAKTHLGALTDKSFDNDWERNLVSYLRGDIDAQTLVGRAQDACQETEAAYFIGFTAWLDGDAAQAKARFEQVVELDIPTFYEFHSAKYLLDKLDHGGRLQP